MAEKDTAEKILEAYNDVFADIVNVLLFGGDEVIKPDELSDEPPGAAYRSEGGLHEIERDVAKHWMKTDVRIACIGMENQSQPDPYMPLRVLGYDGAEYRSQLSKERRGQPCYPVVTLVLYFGTDRRWNGPQNLHGAIDIPERFKPYVPDYRINLFEIGWLDDETVAKFRSDFRIVADYFTQIRKNQNYIPNWETISHVYATLQLLSVMSGDNRFLEAAEETDYTDREVHRMSEFLNRIVSEGRAEGKAEGRAEGRAEGLVEGTAKGKIDLLVELVRDKLLSVSAAAGKLNITEEQFEKLLESK